MRYSDIIAQHDVKQLLQQQVREGRVPHAQLFCGPEGCGKLPTALAFAAALLCRQPIDGAPCGHCAACKMVDEGAHPDLHFVFPVRKSKEVSDQYLPQWRAQLKETPYFDLAAWSARLGVENQQPHIFVAESDSILRKLSLAAQQGGYKVMLIWLPELMQPQTANKLLKILEEPTPQTAFVLVSNHPELLLSTIVSRTQRVEFKAIGTEQLSEALVRLNHLEADAALEVARAAEGSYVKALQQLHRGDDDALFFDLFVLLMRLCYQRKIKELYEWSEQVAGWGRERQKAFLAFCQRLLRENFIYNFRRAELSRLAPHEADFARNFARFINERNVIGIMDELSAAQTDISQNVNPRMVFFDFCLKMIVLLLQ